MRHYCTYFDSRYLNRGLALHASLRRHASPFTLWVLALDEPCRATLERLELPEIAIVSLASLESAFPALREARTNRTVIEYYFTCTPHLPLHLLRTRPEIDRITYLDADLFFFSSPEGLYSPDDPPIGIIPHRFSAPLAHLEAYGRFNVGWLDFRKSPEAQACLEHWGLQCLAWCHDRLEEGRYGDQKYLDAWPSLYPVRVLDHPGANLAPWNLGAHSIDDRGGRVQVDGRPLIFFHFHGLKRVAPALYDPSLRQYGGRLDPAIRRAVYLPYLKCLKEVASSMILDSIRSPSPSPMRACLDISRGLLSRQLILCP